MQSYNPYAPPAHDPGAFTAGHASGCWREGDAVVVRRPDADLPDRCVRCNEPAGGFRLQRKLQWHHPAVYFALLISPIIYGIALIVRKTTTVRVGLCPGHRARRRNGMLVGWLGTLASITACTAGIAADTPEAMLGGLALFLVSVVAGIVMSQVVQPKKIDESNAWLRVGKRFLESLERCESRAMSQYVALLRGINVGGNNLIKMIELKACFEAAGLSGRGHVHPERQRALRGERAEARQLTRRIEKVLAATFNYRASVVLRSRKQMQRHRPARAERLRRASRPSTATTSSS